MYVPTCAAVLVFLSLHLPPPLHCASLPRCAEAGRGVEGYTYSLDPDTGRKVWSFCQFPDPRNDHAHCGLPDWSSPAFLCDPDNLIGDSQQAERVNLVLNAIQTNTSRQCSGPTGQRQGFIAAIVLVDDIRVGSPYQTDSCTNECGEIYPTVNTSARAPSDSEITVAMETFAQRLRSGYRMGACGNDLIFLYSKTYNRVQVAMGYKVADLLDSSQIESLQSRFLDYVNRGDLEGALLMVATQLRSDLRGLMPATIMFIITMLGAVLLFVFLVFYLHLNDVHYNVWGHDDVLSRLTDVTVKTVTWVYFIDWVVMATAHVSHRMPLWPLVVLLVAGLTLIALYVAIDDLYT